MMRKIVLGKELLGKSPRLVGYDDRCEYSAGQRGPKVGLWLDILLPEAGFEKLRVAYAGMTLPVSQDDIAARNAQFAPYRVDFEGFSATPYVDRSGHVAYSAIAEIVKFPELKEG